MKVKSREKEKTNLKLSETENETSNIYEHNGGGPGRKV